MLTDESLSGEGARIEASSDVKPVARKVRRPIRLAPLHRPVTATTVTRRRPPAGRAHPRPDPAPSTEPEPIRATRQRAGGREPADDILVADPAPAAQARWREI